MALHNFKMASVTTTTTTTGGLTNQKSSAWNQLDQLLTCAICLDRYRNPKLLPCQHTFCMEPCLEGLIDYVRRQIKCPECRAEHRIPYQGIQGYPTNVTLMRFLELHFEVTGEVPDPTPTVMERCGVCSEKSYLGFCAHCEKKVCHECKEAHLDIMKREISRINNQVRRGLHRLQDALGQSDKSAQQLQNNSAAVIEEIEQVYSRLQKELRDRQEALKNEVHTFVQGEVRGALQLKENLEIEVSNIESNCDLAEKHVTDSSEWEDVELLEYKDTFLKTLEFLRNFDPDQADFNRRLKFQLGPEPEAIHNNLSHVGELVISAPNFPGSCVTNTLGVASAAGMGTLMRSKSEHRLASAGATQRHDTYLALAQRMSGHSSDTETREGGGRSSPLTRRRTGDLSESSSALRRGRDHDDVERPTYGSRRFGREYGGESRSWQRSNVDDDTGSGYRSRFSRDTGDLSRDSSEGDIISSSRSVRFASRHQENIQEQQQQVPRERVFETEDATRGPMSGIARLMDVPRVMQKLQQHEIRAKHQKLQQVQQQQQQQLLASMPVPQPPPAVTPVMRRTARQLSEDDEIAKQKAQNKVQQQTTTPTSPPPPPESPTRPLARRVAALQREESTNSSTRSSHSPESEVDRRRYGRGDEVTTRKPDSSTEKSSRPMSRQSSTVETRPTNHSTTSSESSSSKEEESPQPSTQRRRFVSKSQADHSSDSESDSKTPTPQTGAPPARQLSLEDLSGQEKPNYFRFRTAAYSRTPSNSSVNLDSQDESTTPTVYTKSRPADTGDKAAVTSTTGKDRAKSPDSSSSSSSDGGGNVRPSLSSVTSSGTTSALKTMGGLPTSSGTSIPSYRNRVETAAEVKDAAGRHSSTGSRLTNTGRTFSLEGNKEDNSKTTNEVTTTKPRFVSRFLPRSRSLHNEDSSDSDSDTNNNNNHNNNNKDTSIDSASPISALLARSAIARRENTSTTGSSRHHLYGSSRDKEESSGRRSTTSTTGATGSGSSYHHHHHGRDDYKKDHDVIEGRYSSLASKYLNRSRPSLCDVDDTTTTTTTGSSSRYLSKSKSSAALLSSSSFDDNNAYNDSRDSSPPPTRRQSVYDRRRDSATGTSRYSSTTTAAATSISGRRNSRIGRSKSSHELNGGDDDDDLVEDNNEDYHHSHQGRSGHRFQRPSVDITRSRSHTSLYSSPDEGDDDGGGGCSSSSLSSWARYLKNKYGYKGVNTRVTEEPCKTYLGRSRSSHALYSREASSESCEEEEMMEQMEEGANCYDIPLVHDATRRHSSISHYSGCAGLTSGSSSSSTTTAARSSSAGAGVAATTTTSTSSAAGSTGENPRSAYLQKRRIVMKIGKRGGEAGCFTWPRGIAVGLDNNIVVADSSNHRVQVFDTHGTFRKEFGAYGNAEGEFDCLAGVAVNRIGQYIVSDRYNHRIQVFDPSGRFLRAFGSQGSVDGKLSYPWGIATDSLGFIYVCDKENHRIQVFQSDGTFVGKFGSLGCKAGQLEHPHYIAVSSTNKVVVSDSNNHRVQIFDVNGKVLSTFGVEGTEQGQFKFPRGVAVDDQGFIIVGDSGNNRIQVFSPDGNFLKSFGTWGSGDGEFKGLEGVAVTSDGSIMVCDRENHRIQIF